MVNTFRLYLTFAVLIIITVLSANSLKIFDYHPASVHQWRQSDCAAYVKTYYRTGSSLWQPATFNLAGTNGRVASEFPIIYYVSAKLQHVVGEHYWVVRGLDFLCYLIGLIALLAFVKRLIPNLALALVPIFILATSPYYYYYAINFLPNVPAISFSFVGLYFFVRYRETDKLLHLINGTLFFILSTLLKPTDGGIIWVAYVATIMWRELIDRKKSTSKKQIVPIIISSFIIGICFLAWTKYVAYYNNLNNNHQNLQGLYPIWDMDKNLILYTRKRIVTEWSNVFQQKLIIAFTVCCLIIYIFKWKSLNRFLRVFTLFLMLGTVCYAICWFKAFADHDYYQLINVIPSVFLMVTVLEYFNRAILPKLGSKGVGISYAVCILLVAIGIYHNRNIQHNRYTDPIYVYINPALYDIGPYLQKMGIKSSDVVVCVPDKSPNMSLNAVNHYGYSEEFNDANYNISKFKQMGAAYLIISDSSYLHKPLYVPYVKKMVGEYKGIYIFDIR